jgi:hypothetical protein
MGCLLFSHNLRNIGAGCIGRVFTFRKALEVGTPDVRDYLRILQVIFIFFDVDISLSSIIFREPLLQNSIVSVMKFLEQYRFLKLIWHAEIEYYWLSLRPFLQAMNSPLPEFFQILKSAESIIGGESIC